MKSPIKILFIIVSTLTQNVNCFHFDILNIIKPHPEQAISLVKASTAILPQFDSIGHFVLHTNEVLINKVLDTNLEPELKKKLILKIIEMSKQGDEMGGKILQDYYNFVDYLL